MSGSSSTGGVWRELPQPPSSNGLGGGGGSAGSDPCVIEEVTTLNSVSMQALKKIRVGDVLTVVSVAGPPRRLVARDSAGNQIGSITSRSMLQIIECIQSGRSYVADVISIQGGACQVRVHLA